jgi:hypothetical protein
MSLNVPRLPAYALPAYVRTPEERERFELSHALAEAISAQYEPDGRPDAVFVFHMREHIYASDIPTGGPDDVPPPGAITATE